MELQTIEYDISVCKLDSIEQADLSREFVFLLKTPEEITLVCESAYIPSNIIEVETGWKALKISGLLDFGLIGVIAKIAKILAEIEISIFVVSTYNTDYILMKTENYDRGIRALIHNGYIVN